MAEPVFVYLLRFITKTHISYMTYTLYIREITFLTSSKFGQTIGFEVRPKKQSV